MRTASANIASNSDLVSLSLMEGLSLETNDAPAGTAVARKHADYGCRLGLMAGSMPPDRAPRRQTLADRLNGCRRFGSCGRLCECADCSGDRSINFCRRKTGFLGGFAYLECNCRAKPLVGSRQGCRGSFPLSPQPFRTAAKERKLADFFPDIDAVVFAIVCAILYATALTALSSPNRAEPGSVEPMTSRLSCSVRCAC